MKISKWLPVGLPGEPIERVVFCEPTLPARHEAADRIARATGAVMIHPYGSG
ncbi:MAG: hypothetical protein AB9869_22875 [Verrucomicrobiia bacterium]